MSTKEMDFFGGPAFIQSMRAI